MKDMIRINQIKLNIGLNNWDKALRKRAANIITVDPKDFGSDDVLAGVEFQRRLEKKAFELAGGKIPVERYGDFKTAVKHEVAETLKLVKSLAQTSCHR